MHREHSRWSDSAEIRFPFSRAAAEYKQARSSFQSDATCINPTALPLLLNERGETSRWRIGSGHK
jgi:hypothetical protein